MRLNQIIVVGLIRVISSLSAQAQSAPYTLTPFDTVGVMRKGGVVSYSYHQAQKLAAEQVLPLMLASPDSLVQRLARRSRRRYRLVLPVTLGSYGLLLGGVRAVRIPNYTLAGTLTLGSLALSIDAIGMGLSASSPLNRAVGRYNQLIRASDNSFVNPLLRVSADEFRLKEADTVSAIPKLLRTRYVYRGIQVVPDLQLANAIMTLHDPYLTEGLRQTKLVRTVGGIVGSISAGFLTTYYLTRGLSAAAGGRVRGGVSPLVYGALGGLALSMPLTIWADRTTRQVVSRYNERLRER